MSDKIVFAVEETHGRVLRPGNELVANSPDAGWQSLYAAKFREAPLRTDEDAIGHPSLIYHIAHPTRVLRKIAGADSRLARVHPAASR